MACARPYVDCSDWNLVKIYWELNGLHQEDAQLIESIKNEVLIPPDALSLSMLGGPSMKRLMGQFNQVPVVEKLLALKKRKKKKSGFFIEAGAGTVLEK